VPFKIRVVVIGFQPDHDPVTGEEYTQVNLGVKIPIPSPPREAIFPPPPKTMMWKHIIHLFVPTSKWVQQYSMWQEYDLEIKDNGEIELSLVKEET
jgi:hypothetical protein